MESGEDSAGNEGVEAAADEEAEAEAAAAGEKGPEAEVRRVGW